MTGMRRWATISPDGAHRFVLGREWDPQGTRVCWVMSNPSTADADLDDPTIRRCITFSQQWGHGSLVVVNLYSQRATDPDDLDPAVVEAGRAENWTTVKAALDTADAAVMAWGAAWAVHGLRERRMWRPNVEGYTARVAGLTPMCLGVTKDGHPRHPLYVAKATKLAAYTDAWQPKEDPK